MRWTSKQGLRAACPCAGSWVYIQSLGLGHSDTRGDISGELSVQPAEAFD